MSLTLHDSTLRSHMPDTQVNVLGELKPFAGADIQTTYQILFCNERMAVVEVAKDMTGERGVTTYFFVGTDALWIYEGANHPAMPDLHIREYFKRVP